MIYTLLDDEKNLDVDRNLHVWIDRAKSILQTQVMANEELENCCSV